MLVLSNEDISFVPGETICDTCSCALPQTNTPFTLDCTARGLSNILSMWPAEFEPPPGNNGNSKWFINHDDIVIKINPNYFREDHNRFFLGQ